MIIRILILNLFFLFPAYATLKVHLPINPQTMICLDGQLSGNCYLNPTQRYPLKPLQGVRLYNSTPWFYGVDLIKIAKNSNGKLSAQLRVINSKIFNRDRCDPINDTNCEISNQCWIDEDEEYLLLFDKLPAAEFRGTRRIRSWSIPCP